MVTAEAETTSKSKRELRSPTDHAAFHLWKFELVSRPIRNWAHNQRELRFWREAKRCFARCAVFASVALLVGCSRGHDRADVVIVNGPEVESLDPALLTVQGDMRVGSALFEGLTRYDPQTAVATPGIAERWTISTDGATYTFTLRENARWSTGEPIVADDFLFSWRRLLEPGTGAEYASLLFYVRNGEEFASGKTRDPNFVGISAPDPHTFRVELIRPTPFFIEICALPALAVVSRKAVEHWGDRWTMQHPIPASGAFQLEFWRLNDRIRLRKNPNYWDAANTQSETIDILACSRPATALNLYENGQADIVWDKDLIPAELVDVLRRRPDFHSFDSLGTYFVRFNVTRKPLDDARVRRALALAIDKASIVGKITRAGERVAASLVPPSLPNYSAPPGLPHDPVEARRLLAEAGFPGGAGFPRIEYGYNTSRAHEAIGVELQGMWERELGIHVELRNVESKVFFQAQSALEYDIGRSSWVGDYNDPTTFLDLFLSNNGNNRTGWKNPRYDALLAEANGKADPVARAKLLQEAETLLIQEEAPIMPLYIYATLEAYDERRITGVYQNVRSEHPLRSIRRLER